MIFVKLYNVIFVNLYLICPRKQLCMWQIKNSEILFALLITDFSLKRKHVFYWMCEGPATGPTRTTYYCMETVPFKSLSNSVLQLPSISSVCAHDSLRFLFLADRSRTQRGLLLLYHLHLKHWCLVHAFLHTLVVRSAYLSYYRLPVS